MKTSLFYLPSVGTRTDIEAGMAGLRGDLYQRMLQDVGEQARLADALGYDSINFTGITSTSRAWSSPTIR